MTDPNQIKPDLPIMQRRQNSPSSLGSTF